MRDIKFRAWNDALPALANVLEIRLNQHALLTDESKYLWDLDRVVLDQYTGLKDMNSMDVYENDIVKIDIQDCPGGFYRETIYTGVVKFNISEGGFFVKITKNPDISFSDAPDSELGAGWYQNDIEALMFYEFSEDDIKVLGNEHQNLELLEG